MNPLLQGIVSHGARRCGKIMFTKTAVISSHRETGMVIGTAEEPAARALV
jgi:hypothetical protein